MCGRTARTVRRAGTGNGTPPRHRASPRPNQPHSGVHLHALASLLLQAQQFLPQAVADARDQELSWDEIGQLLGISGSTAARRYRHPRRTGEET